MSISLPRRPKGSAIDEPQTLAATVEPSGLAVGSLAALPPVERSRVRVLTITALALITVLNGVDDVTTHLLLGHHAVEANPLAGVLLENGSLLWVKLGVVATLGVISLRVPPRLGVLVLSWTVTGLYAAAVLSNILILRLV